MIRQFALNNGEDSCRMPLENFCHMGKQTTYRFSSGEPGMFKCVFCTDASGWV